jgi:AraC-like DNA-binding protein
VCAAGINKDHLLKPILTTPSALEDSGSRIDMTMMTQLWQRAVELTGDQTIGLKVGGRIRPGSFHIVASIVMNCSTIAQALEMMLKYHGLVSEGGSFRYEALSSGIDIVYVPNPMPIPMTQYQVEGVLCSIVNFIRWLLNNEFSPDKVSFCHRIDHNPLEYEYVFGCPVEFGAYKNMIRLNRHHLSTSIPQSDPELCRYHQSVADELLANLKKGKKTSLMLRSWLQNQQEILRVTLNQAAEQMKMSPRTLQRQLKKEFISYQELRNNVVMEKAHHLLFYSEKSITEIAEELGYINNSSFYRGFRKFYKMAPSEYRCSRKHV